MIPRLLNRERSTMLLALAFVMPLTFSVWNARAQ